MDQSTQFTPEMVFNLIANNPQGRIFVENLARANQLQQAARQFVPQIQQFAQNPIQGMQQVGDWAQGAINQQQMQPANQEGGNPTMGMGGNNAGGMMGMAMDLVGEFRTSIKAMSETLNELKTANTELSEKVESLSNRNNSEGVDNISEMIKESNYNLSKDMIDAIKDSNSKLSKQVADLTKDNKTLIANLSAVKEDIKKFV